MRSAPNLVLIEGTKATRYVSGKATEVALIDYTVAPKYVLEHIEFFRTHGLPLEDEVGEPL